MLPPIWRNAERGFFLFGPFDNLLHSVYNIRMHDLFGLVKCDHPMGGSGGHPLCLIKEVIVNWRCFILHDR